MAQSLSALRAGRFLLQGRFLVLISVRGWVDPRAIVRLEGLGKLKKSTSSGLELATFQLVATACPAVQVSVYRICRMKCGYAVQVLVYHICSMKCSYAVQVLVYHICDMKCSYAVQVHHICRMKCGYAVQVLVYRICSMKFSCTL
jgi:hypothetical protein